MILTFLPLVEMEREIRAEKDEGGRGEQVK